MTGLVAITRALPVTLLLIAAIPIAAQQPPPGAPGGPGPGRGPMEIAVTDLGNNVFMLSAGSNAMLAVGTDGAILVDSLLANANGLAGKIAAITPRPLKYVLNTHSHLDHTGGNEALATLGPTIVATQRAANVMARPGTGPNGAVILALAPAARPKETFTGSKTITVGGVRAVMTEVPPAHTEGDAYVYFPDANVLVMGDLHHSHEYPVWSASFEGNLQAYDAMLKIVNDQTKIVPGHGPVTNKADVTRYVAMLRRVRSQVDALVMQGKTADEVVDMKLLANDTTTYPGGPDNRDRFIRTLYDAEKTGRGK